MYVEHGIEPGGFLCALLDNDLLDAVSRADDSLTMTEMRAVAQWFYNFVTSACHDLGGSNPGARTKWCGMGRARAALNAERIRDAGSRL
jgi:hypothetical protein